MESSVLWTSLVGASPSSNAAAVPTTDAMTSTRVQEIRDPSTYTGLVYEPPPQTQQQQQQLPPPLLVVLHGAGRNTEPSVWNALGDPRGEHAGLPLQLLLSNQAPADLSDNFCVIAPYTYGSRSWLDEPRDKVLQYVQYLASSGRVRFDPTRLFLFGFSDGATVAVEIATSRKFRGVVVASYGFTGPALPVFALQRLKGIGVWVWHSADDVIFDVGNSDRLVAALRETNEVSTVSSRGGELVRYTRYDKDPLPAWGIAVDPASKGHTMGYAASRSPELYQWLLSL